MSRALAGRLGAAPDLVVVDSAGKSVDVVARGAPDVGFFAVDPARVAQLRFTAPYLPIQGAYLVRADSPLQSPDDVDRTEHQVVVGKGSAYDLHLSRELQPATIVRAPTSPTVVDEFLLVGADVAKGVRQQLESDCQRFPRLRVLPGNFMTIRQAMGVCAERGDEVRQVVAKFVEDMKADGFIERALARHGVAGARAAPLES